MQGDTRSPSSHLAWSVSADVEALAWDPSNPTHFLASSEDGIVAAFDARSGGNSAPLFRLSAHDKPACCLNFNPAANGLLATASTDKQVIPCKERSLGCNELIDQRRVSKMHRCSAYEAFLIQAI